MEKSVYSGHTGTLQLPQDAFLCFEPCFVFVLFVLFCGEGGKCGGQLQREGEMSRIGNII